MKQPLSPVIEFLERTAPFQLLTHEELTVLAGYLEIEYFRRGSELRKTGQRAERLLIVRAGALTETDGAAFLVSHYGEGEVANVEELLTGALTRTSLHASEDSLIYSLILPRFEQLLESHTGLARSFTSTVSERLRQASLDLAQTEPSFSSISLPIGNLITRSLISISADATIQQAAELMSKKRISALVVTGDPALGIVTDRDLRSRVVATGLNPKQAVRSIMTCPTITIDKGTSVFEAILLMTERSLHHLVVTENNQPLGLVTTTDLARSQSESPVHLVGEIDKQTSIEDLARANQRRERVLLRLIAGGARAYDLHRVLSRISDAVVRRLIVLTKLELENLGLGPLPEHCWVVFGSQARNELSLGSDQDNALVLGPGVNADDPVAALFAGRVCEGLDLCGYPKCKGEIMAMNPKWRQPLETWQAYFHRWITTPEKEAIMRASIFFDMRALEGNAELLNPLADLIGREVKQRPVFLAHMARDAMVRRPPLGFFRQFVVEKGGQHVASVDLKHCGVIPIVDLARVLALEAGYTGPGTLDRLAQARDGKTLSAEGASELSSAFEFIALLRLKHQAMALSDGQPPDSYLKPDQLSSTDRRHLRDAFSVIKTIQEAVSISHQLGGFSG